MSNNLAREDNFENSIWPDWTEDLKQELNRNTGKNGRVGSELVSATDRVRIWLISLHPGQRLEFHTHVLDYFWTATSKGKARSRYSDGRVVEMEYTVGQTQHHKFKSGESMTHDLENIGENVLHFTTVEFLDSANAPLKLI